MAINVYGRGAIGGAQNAYQNKQNKKAEEEARKLKQQQDYQKYRDSYNRVQQELRRKRIEGYIPKPIESVAEQGPKELQDVLSQRQRALAGYEAPELAAMQAQAALAQQGGETQRQRALEAALAKQGVRGGAAAALQAQSAQMAAREKAALGQEMLLKQEERQRGALSEYEKGVLQSLGLGQQRQFMELATKLAGEQLLSAENIAQLRAEAERLYGERQERIAKESGGGCCIVACIVSEGLLNSGISEAKANEIIQLSKQPDIKKEMIVLNDAESKAWDNLNALRFVRDSEMSVAAKRGYYRLSEFIVPKFSKVPGLKYIANKSIVEPAIHYGKTGSKLSGMITKTWFKVYELFSNGKPYVRSNGEIV